MRPRKVYLNKPAYEYRYQPGKGSCKENSVNIQKKADVNPRKRHSENTAKIVFDDSDIKQLEQDIKNVQMPKYAKDRAEDELAKIKTMKPSLNRANGRSYINHIISLPWYKEQEKIDFEMAGNCLDKHHYGLKKIKERILQEVAKRKNILQKGNLQTKGFALCIVGPPGTGKTTICKSIADAFGRKYSRISLGESTDASKVKGLSRLFEDSGPGDIVKAIEKNCSKNPVILLDEIDKIDYKVAAALLDVLDFEQNHQFHDLYLDLPFDLSHIIFLSAANDWNSIPPALQDRLDKIEIGNYTDTEKMNIAKRHIIPKEIEECGFSDEDITIPDDVLQILVSVHPNKKGIRSLARKISRICGHVAVTAERLKKRALSESPSSEIDVDYLPYTVTAEDLGNIMPLQQREREKVDVQNRLGVPGIVPCLSCVSGTGKITFVEAVKIHSAKKLLFTGKLGTALKESNQVAMNWCRDNAERLNLGKNTDILKGNEVHIHFPEGDINKDGASAGVSIAVVIISLFTNRCVKMDVAMTGEISLKGKVLRVGGIPEKLKAALSEKNNVIKKVLIPEKNLPDVPDDMFEKLNIVGVEEIDDVLDHVFEGGYDVLRRQ